MNRHMQIEVDFPDYDFCPECDQPYEVAQLQEYVRCVQCGTYLLDDADVDPPDETGRDEFS